MTYYIAYATEDGAITAIPAGPDHDAAYEAYVERMELFAGAGLDLAKDLRWRGLFDLPYLARNIAVSLDPTLFIEVDLYPEHFPGQGHGVLNAGRFQSFQGWGLDNGPFVFMYYDDDGSVRTTPPKETLLEAWTCFEEHPRAARRFHLCNPITAAVRLLREKVLKDHPGMVASITRHTA